MSLAVGRDARYILPMQGLDKNTFRWVLGVHVVIFVVLISHGLFSGCFRSPPDRVIPIEFLVDVRQAAPEPDVAPPVPDPAPRQEAPPPVPVPAATPRPPREIRVNTNRVVRQTVKPQPQPVATTPNPLSAEEIQRLLDAGATASTVTSIPDSDGRGLALIRKTLYAIWEVPSRAAVGNAEATLELVLEEGGAVKSARVVKPSGNPVLDDSVALVAEKIGRIHGLPSGFVARWPRVTIAFSVE